MRSRAGSCAASRSARASSTAWSTMRAGRCTTATRRSASCRCRSSPRPTPRARSSTSPRRAAGSRRRSRASRSRRARTAQALLHRVRRVRGALRRSMTSTASCSGRFQVGAGGKPWTRSARTRASRSRPRPWASAYPEGVLAIADQDNDGEYSNFKLVGWREARSALGGRRDGIRRPARAGHRHRAHRHADARDAGGRDLGRRGRRPGDLGEPARSGEERGHRAPTRTSASTSTTSTASCCRRSPTGA